MLRWVLLGLLLTVATITDLRERRIPNVLTLAGCIAGLAVGAGLAGVDGFLDSGRGLLFAFALTLPFWLFGWLGAGDVKLISAVGAFVGGGLVLKVLLAIGVAGGLLAVGALLWRGLLAKTGERLAATFNLSLTARRWIHVEPGAQERDVRLPYAIAISAGTVAAVTMFG